jgi:hypothetical protein
MSQFNIVLTNDGLILQQAAQAGETLTFTRIALGDGTLVGDPRARTALVSQKQTSNVASVVPGENTVTIRADFSNSGLGAGYNMREIGLFATRSGAPGVEKLYAYGNSVDAIDYMPAGGGSDVITMVQELIVTSGDAEVTAVVDPNAVYVTHQQWNGHVGVGGTAQHPAATAAVAGFMSSADKSKLDGHVGVGGAANHPYATPATSGFMSNTDKSKLDGIAAGAEVNQNAFSTVKVGATNIAADGKTDTVELVAGANIALTPDAALDKVTIAAPNVAPSSHVGSGGAAHAVATQVAAGFMSAADKTKLDGHVGVAGSAQHPVATAALSGFMANTDKTKLDGIQAGAEVNQNTFSIVKVGATNIQADLKSDTLEIAAGANISITPDAANDKVTFGLALPYYTLRMNNAAVQPALADVLAHAKTFPIGPYISPKGGIYFSGSIDLQYTVIFEMRVNNVSGAQVARTLQLPMVDDDLYIQIDNGAISLLVDGSLRDTTAVINIPSGIHIVRFYFKNINAGACMLSMGDWLDSAVQWEAGGTYY